MEPRRAADYFAIFFDPKVPLTFIAGSIVLAVLGNSLYDLLLRLTGADTSLPALVRILVASLLIFLAIITVSWLWLGRRRVHVLPTIPKALEATPHASLVLFVSEGQQQSARAAIDFHLRDGTLRRCWLIASPEVQEKASTLADELRPRVEVAMLPLPDAFQAQASYRVVREALLQAAQRPEHQPVIVDITGGTKPMTAGAVLACFDQNTPMQYMRTVFESGRAVVDAQPQAMKVEPL